MKRETFAVNCSKFFKDTMYQLLSESAKFCRRYDKNILAYFFLGHGVIVH